VSPSGVTAAERVVRLLQNPSGQQAPKGECGDLVRVSDGQSSVYPMPWEFDATDERTLRVMLARPRFTAS
jgi:hypothetical protein